MSEQGNRGLACTHGTKGQAGRSASGDARAPCLWALLPSAAARRCCAVLLALKHGSPHTLPPPPSCSYSLAYLWTITRTFRTLLKLPYNMMRRANLVVRIQVGGNFPWQRGVER